MASLPRLQLPITTEHLEVRSFTPADADVRFHIHADPMIQEYFGHNPTREESDRHLMRDIEQQGPDGRWALAVCDRQSGEMAGICVLQDWNGDCEIVLGLVEQFRCKGLGSELAHAVTNAAFLDSSLKRIMGRVAVENLKSLALVRSLGMSEVGTAPNQGGGYDLRFELRPTS